VVSTRPASTSPRFDAERPHRLPDHVSLRREDFGALIYDHHRRRLLFLKSDLLTDVVEYLGAYPSAAAALEALAPGSEEIRRSLQRLYDGGLICVAD
jgi:putative mycofactocin binding protein MftB